MDGGLVSISTIMYNYVGIYGNIQLLRGTKIYQLNTEYLQTFYIYFLPNLCNVWVQAILSDNYF